MIHVINYNTLESIVDSLSEEWDIRVTLKDANFSKNLPETKKPKEGIIYYPKRINFLLLLYQLVREGLVSGKPLIELNDKINAALSVGDTDSFEELKYEYCDQIQELYFQFNGLSEFEYCLDTTVLFYLYHEITHIRIAQHPSFFDEKKEELKQRVQNALPILRQKMNKSLQKDNRMIEEVICDIEACKLLRMNRNNQVEFKKTLLDIVHTLNIMNSVNNIRKLYINTKCPTFLTLIKLTHSKETRNSISRFSFIQNYWKDEIMLNSKEIMSDIYLTARIFSLGKDTISFCRDEYDKGEKGIVKCDKVKEKLLKKEICSLEDSFVSLIATAAGTN